MSALAVTNNPHKLGSGIGEPSPPPTRERGEHQTKGEGVEKRKFRQVITMNAATGFQPC